MNEFERGLVSYIGEDKLEKLKKVKVGIAGAGGLGSNCAFNLVRSGFCKLKIVDFDVVEPSNLNRQFYFLDQLGMPKVLALKENLERINPEVRIETIQQRVEQYNAKNLFDDCDAVVEAFDRVNCKTMMAERFYSSGKFFVCASGLAGWGNSDDIKVRKVHDKFYMVGDSVSEVKEGVPPISPRVNIAAAKQADLILNYFLNKD
ncbi:MAG TPA: sulfur carrier protein ThiS adenylyltransferase ThiF [Ruminiclostridium sp.]|jgi:sulfur carrier protein ThiS adenylyltransferase|nr:sulfur carrier protein ThiS adenylyltransferase ThiF [Clostridium sp.]HAA43523.1 sulfur carrier protein ThiS adenylyltransferase ThiF [Ruminiclostridium sp.]HOQ36369.1 sulfur carrier protein ThiS adenylyltransferase ThiF [Acetivibrio sp.]HPT91107.1 sulfur carrier protein ThiS adenylyltransferase ThiF [Acetivibrio sp.]HQA56706.1 sulfur carrier protein ThiS adenylyltransferase ThiF [Acetivibrio sp.]